LGLEEAKQEVKVVMELNKVPVVAQWQR
jgi:hypothetical protein